MAVKRSRSSSTKPERAAGVSRRKLNPGLRSKWTEKEDETLVNAVNMYLEMKASVDFRMIASTIPGRTTKQCRERYENSLAPVKRGDWSLDEIIRLSDLMIIHGQNWADLRDSFQDRSYNGIKKKGRKILGEITVSNNKCHKSNFKLSKSKVISNTEDVQEEPELLLRLHEKHGYNFKVIASSLPQNKSEAELERILLKNCKCQTCSIKYTQIEIAMKKYSEDYKKAWTRIKAAEKKQEFIERKKLGELKTNKTKTKTTTKAKKMSRAVSSIKKKGPKSSSTIKGIKHKKCPSRRQDQFLKTECIKSEYVMGVKYEYDYMNMSAYAATDYNPPFYFSNPYIQQPAVDMFVHTQELAAAEKETTYISDDDVSLILDLFDSE